MGIYKLKKLVKQNEIVFLQRENSSNTITKMLFFSPLEQFQILPYLTVKMFFLIYDMSLAYKTNETFIIFELIYETVSGMVFDNIGEKGQIYFPFLISIFLFVLMINVIGLIPYSFTMTSHLCVTLALALTIFIGINIIGIKTHGLHMVTLFLPAGTSLGMALILVPIEIVSYFVKPISLSVRLFANMMAGHTLLKVIAGFAWSMFSAGGLLFIAHFVPIFVLILLMGLEFGVAIIQAYVFTILTCIYLNDAINLH